MASALALRSNVLCTVKQGSTASRVLPGLRSYYAPRLLVKCAVVPQYAPYIRSLHTTRSAYQPTPSSSSKDVAPTTTTSGDKAVATTSTKKGTRLQRIWASVKKEASHYWHGTKLLGKEIRISARIQGRLLAGKKLTRRERRQVRNMFIHPIDPFADRSHCHATAEANYSRLAAVNSILSVLDRPFHGVVTPCRPQAIPKHAAVYFHRQVQGGKSAGHAPQLTVWPH